jgi:hypothetical protein
MTLLPPNEVLQFPSRKALIDGLQAHAKSNGYAITIQRSNAKDTAIYFHCNRGVVYKARNGLTNTNRRGDTGTRLVDCPFSIRTNLKEVYGLLKYDAVTIIIMPTLLPTYIQFTNGYLYQFENKYNIYLLQGQLLERLSLLFDRVPTILYLYEMF